MFPGRIKPNGYPIVEADFKKTFDVYFDKLYRYAFTIVQDNSEAKDIVQSAFIKLWAKRNEVDAERPYLYTTVYNLSLNAVRNRTVRARHLQYLGSLSETDRRYTSEEKEIVKRINQVIEKLPPKCREIFQRNRFEGKKYAEIATELGISVKTVEAQMGKALKHLRENLSDLLMVMLVFTQFIH
jgi:RNA polymerase sigma-70 factor (ECF subfamily)